MNVHGPARNLQTKLTVGRFCLTTRFMYTALLNVTCPGRVKTDNALQGGKEVVRYLVVSIYLSMICIETRCDPKFVFLPGEAQRIWIFMGYHTKYESLVVANRVVWLM